MKVDGSTLIGVCTNATIIAARLVVDEIYTDDMEITLDDCLNTVKTAFKTRLNMDENDMKFVSITVLTENMQGYGSVYRFCQGEWQQIGTIGTIYGDLSPSDSLPNRKYESSSI